MPAPAQMEERTGSRGPALTAPVLVQLAAAAATGVVATIVVAPEFAAASGLPAPDPLGTSLLAAAAAFLWIGGVVALRRPGAGGASALVGVLFWMAGCIVLKSFGWLHAVPPVLGLLGGVTSLVLEDRRVSAADAMVVYRHDVLTRVTHWVWAVALFFLLLSGLQIFNARPNLYIGHESGFAYQNSILDIYAINRDGALVGQTRIFGQVFDTTGVLGVSGTAERPALVAFPGWATIPSYRDLATGRVVHFFFAWILVGTLGVWLVNGLFSGHLWRDIILKPRDLRELPRDLLNHFRLRLSRGRTYTPLQKLAYFAVMAILFPTIVLTGLAMSPGMNAAWPWLVDIYGGRQTARTVHFLAMVALVLFFIVHVVMVVLAGPLNELRSMITGYYRTRRAGHVED